MTENPFASPQLIEEETVEVKLVSVDGDLAKRQAPPVSLQLAWLLGVVLLPIKFISLLVFGPCGVLMIAALVGMLVYLLKPRRWVWPAALVFFLFDAAFLAIGIAAAIHFGLLMVAIVVVVGVTLCLIICGCLFQRSAWDYYHRTTT
ncbi:hypothetical protein DTL42_07790 [Bremerella cremea]|uniref:Uncharacterized protein n=1 Tax=Bremerella cremea TaxID=1031537 RepID=A0A368KWI6_9BACT|nr:hypothetical protein [Bremerella cremea]RCS52729.1 hypothetical protein DTL42_07790 [Bremerella cremea]